MGLKTLVIGYGSIGETHVRILNNMKHISTITVLTKQKNIHFLSINDIKHIIDLDPDYIVIASPTNSHFRYFKYIEEVYNNKLLLIEKPLFLKSIKVSNIKNTIFVGYNLRFHPVLKKIKTLIEDKHIYSFHVYCGSFLPSWRKRRDYRNTSSANSRMGGAFCLI